MLHARLVMTEAREKKLGGEALAPPAGVWPFFQAVFGNLTGGDVRPWSLAIFYRRRRDVTIA